MIKQIVSKLWCKHTVVLLILATAIIVGGVFVNGLDSFGDNAWLYLMVLVCPLMHLFMMHGHGNQQCSHEKTVNEDNKSSEGGQK